MVYRLSFRIRKIYYDQIVAGTKTAEFRKASPFWVVRAGHAMEALENGELVTATFVCAKEVHRRKVVRTNSYKNARDALGREPSDQGRQDLGIGYILGFHLGDAIA
jgi:hypothetical protein